VSQAKATLKTTQIQLSQLVAAIKTASDNAFNNDRTYGQDIENTRRALDEATSTAELKAKNYQLTVDTALATLNQAKSIYFSYADFYGPSGITLSWCASLNTINSNCTTLINDNNAYLSAQKSYDSALNNQKLSLATDTSNLITLNENWIAALTAQRLGRLKDLAAITTAQQALDIYKAQQGIATDAPKDTDLGVAQAALAVAQKNYDATFVRAPVSGTVASIAAGVGQSAPTSSSSVVGAVTGFIVLTDVSSLQVSAGFSEADAAKLVVGQSATFSYAALTNVNSSGKLVAIDTLPTTTNGATSYKATFSIDGKVDGLKPGMTATATVKTGSVSNVLQVTSQAVSIRGRGATVNVLTTKDGKDVITPTPVVVGLQGDSSVEIISGVKEGTKVVLRSNTSSVGTNGFPSVGVPSGLGGAGLAVQGGGGGNGGGRGGRG
jgi:macrolide-specific efflux system membrane fusion protein